MKNSHRSLVGLTAALALSLTACGDEGEASGNGGDGDPGAISMATKPWLGYGPWFIADEQGYFDEEGVDVELTMFDSDADVIAALASGNVDAANVASHTALQYMEQGLDVQIVLLLDASLEADAIIAEPEYTSVSDLEGEQVAFEEGSVSDLLINWALAQEGMSVEDIDVVPMLPSEAATALISGDVPIAGTYEPYISEAQASGADFEVIMTAAEQEGLISDVLVVNQDAIDDNPDGIQAVVNAWGPSIDYYTENTEEGQQIIADGIGSDPEDLRPAFEGVRYYGAEDQGILSGEYREEVLPIVKDASLDAGIIEEEIDLDDVFDLSFVEAAYE